MDGMLALSHEKDRLLSTYLCPVGPPDSAFPFRIPEGCRRSARCPFRPLCSIATVSPAPFRCHRDRDQHTTDIVSSYRVSTGGAPQPEERPPHDAGHLSRLEGGLPIPDDKKAVPKSVFGRLLHHALRPPAELMRLPFTATQAAPAECFVSLLLRPVVCLGRRRHRGEVAGGSLLCACSLVCNLDFVENIFGNGGDPRLPENDAALDPIHWTGHSGCIILAPHLTRLTKQELGLPRREDATERQRRDGMCWRDPAERYNDGVAFKVTARDASGVIVTILSDNYFGYCKKEVKSYISYSANLFGLCEEEHAGGRCCSRATTWTRTSPPRGSSRNTRARCPRR